MPCAFSLIDESIVISKTTFRSQNLSILGRLTSSGKRTFANLYHSFINLEGSFSSCSEEKSPMVPSPNLQIS